MWVFGAIVVACVAFSILATCHVAICGTAIGIALALASGTAGVSFCLGAIHFGNKKADTTALIIEIEKVEKSVKEIGTNLEEIDRFVG